MPPGFWIPKAGPIWEMCRPALNLAVGIIIVLYDAKADCPIGGTKNMKKSKILTAAILGMVILTAINASAGDVDFDGIAPRSQNSARELSFTNHDIPEDLPLPAVAAVTDAYADLDHSILSAIRYSEQKKITPVVPNLKKLLVLGTKAEKIEFMLSAKYTFPQRFVSFGVPGSEGSGSELKSRGYETHCWEDNCRMVEVCGGKKSCERSCELVGVTCAAAGAATTQYYTGGLFPSASAAVGGAAGLGCKWACQDWICADIPDCHEVRKCDSHCETVPVSDGTDHIDPNTGQTYNS